MKRRLIILEKCDKIMILFLQLFLIYGCGPSPKELATIRHSIFVDQVTVNMSVSVVSSPSADDQSQWEHDTGWRYSAFTKSKTQSIFALVYISPSLIDSAVELWSTNRENADIADKQRLLTQLFSQFIRPGEKSFLLVVMPITDTPDWWQLHIGNLFQNVSIITLDGVAGHVARHEKSVDQELRGENGIISCLLYIQDVVNENKDPIFTVSISGIHYLVRPDRKGEFPIINAWVKSVTPIETHFQFVTSEVNILKLVQDNMRLDDITGKYIQPSRSVITSKISEQLVDKLISLTSSLFIRAVFKM